MSDTTCPKCKNNFKYPSLLKTHFKNVYHCLLNEEEINIFFNKNKNNKNNKKNKKNENKCNKCLKTFGNIKALNRHNKETKCGKTQNNINSINLENTSTSNNPITNEDIVNFIKKLSPKLAKNIESLIDKQSQIINSNNNSNNRIINNTNINNNTINNNTINIQYINPFGFEDVRTIPIPEMKNILSSGENAGFQIIKTIYNKIENKNFYKPNMSRPEIACLNTEFKLTIYKSKEFCDALFDRCIAFLHHMLYLCKNEYSKNSIKNIYENIEYIETTMRTEIYDKQLQNIIESEFRNNNIDNKDRIKKFIKEIKENIESKEQSTSLINNLLTFNNESKNEYKISITDTELNNEFGNPKLIL